MMKRNQTAGQPTPKLFWQGIPHPLRSLAILFCLLLALGGCGGSPTTQPAQQQAPSPVNTATGQLSETTTTNTGVLTNTDVLTNPDAPTDRGHDQDDQDHSDSLSLDLSGILPIASGETLNVVATTNIVGDVVGTIGGDAINLTVLIPLGADPHTFEPSPRDIAAIADADVVFANGVGLEAFMENVLASAGADETKVIYVSHGIELIEFAGKPTAEHEDEDTHAEHDDQDHNHSGLDPHLWFSPVSVEGWVANIEQTLGYADPTNAATYTANATAYRAELHDLDAWIEAQVAQVPVANRKLLTDHTAFGYFAHRYGFAQIGAVIPGYSTMAEPSAQELAQLEDTIREHSVPALFVGTTVNPVLSERIAKDTGIQLVKLYTGSLSEAGQPADTYLKLMRYDTQAIVDALAP